MAKHKWIKIDDLIFFTIPVILLPCAFLCWRVSWNWNETLNVTTDLSDLSDLSIIFTKRGFKVLGDKMLSNLTKEVLMLANTHCSCTTSLILELTHYRVRDMIAIEIIDLIYFDCEASLQLHYWTTRERVQKFTQSVELRLITSLIYNRDSSSRIPNYSSSGIALLTEKLIYKLDWSR